MNFLYKKAILCSEKIFLPILFSIISASSSDYVLNANFGEPIHFIITAYSQSNDLVSAKESTSIRFNINSSGLSNYANKTEIDDSRHIIIEQNNISTYLCNIDQPKRIAGIYINQSSISTYLLNAKASSVMYFAISQSSLSSDTYTMKLTPPLYFGLQASSNSSGVIEKVYLKDSIKFAIECNSLSTTSCLIEMSGLALLSDYSNMSLNELDNKTLEDLFYL